MRAERHDSGTDWPAITEQYRDAIATALQAEGRINDAAEHYRRAIALQPQFASAFYNRGVALSDKLDHAEALVSFDTARRLRPDYPFLEGLRLYTKLRICDWSDFGRDAADLRLRLERSEKA